MQRILVLGALGQVGTALVARLRREGYEVLSSDIRTPEKASDSFQALDALDEKALRACVEEKGIDTLFQLVSTLSATAEKSPTQAWKLNMRSLENTLYLAQEKNLRVFWPSSIAVFGPDTPKHATQKCYMNPNTIYGISKLAGERLCAYFFEKYQVDVRSVRYPGLVSVEAPPGGGTTDYVMDMYKSAVLEKDYVCYLDAHTRLPMMSMSDAIEGTLALMRADAACLSIRDSYNISALSFTPKEVERALAREGVENWHVSYAPDERQAIAETWPHRIDDAEARRDWGFAPKYDTVQVLTRYVLQAFRRKHHSHDLR